MRKMTLGQVLVDFDGMTQYIKLTAPFGSGEEEKPARGDTRSAAEVAALSADPEFAAKFRIATLNRKAEHLPAVARMALGLS